MAITASNLTIWEEIERSESYLVSCMYEKAASTASYVLRDLCSNKSAEAGEETPLNDMLESAGMVLVQSLKELGRTQDILNELLMLFGSITFIPVQIILAGVCFQISEGPCSGTREFLGDFLSKWRFVDERYYVAVAESNVGFVKGSGGHFVLGVEEYFEVVEVYVLTLLGRVLKDVDHAISWVEKALLSEEKRQVLLRRLHSPCSPIQTGSSHGSAVAFPENEREPHPSSTDEQITSEGFSESLKASRTFQEKNDIKQLLISNGKIVLSCLMILMYYVLLRKQATVKRILRAQILSMKKGLADLCHLAFSYQVNPLAAVQPVPNATHGIR